MKAQLILGAALHLVLISDYVAVDLAPAAERAISNSLTSAGFPLGVASTTVARPKAGAGLTDNRKRFSNSACGMCRRVREVREVFVGPEARQEASQAGQDGL